jgi:hypothetical protein
MTIVSVVCVYEFYDTQAAIRLRQQLSNDPFRFSSCSSRFSRYGGTEAVSASQPAGATKTGGQASPSAPRRGIFAILTKATQPRW